MLASIWADIVAVSSSTSLDRGEGDDDDEVLLISVPKMAHSSGVDSNNHLPEFNAYYRL